MNFKKVCPRDCPGRYPGCGATCPTWIEHRAESEARYNGNLKERKIDEVMKGSYGRRRRT